VAIVSGAVVGTAVAVGAVTVALPLLGFGANGIVAGSPAAALMSSGVASALVATGQSVAMGGLSTLSWIGLGASGALTGAAIVVVGSTFFGYDSSSESTTQSDAQPAVCIVCNKRPRKIVIYPCTHMMCCQECVEVLEKCPTCSGPIAAKLQVTT
jgi:hypothetical protein